MQLRHHQHFAAIRTEGAILPADLLHRINNLDAALGGLRAEDYHLPSGVKLNEAINQSWNRMLGAWSAFQSARAKLPDGDPATTATREKWLLPLFHELGYGRLLASKAIEIESKNYAVSHLWQNTPIHLVGAGVGLDQRTAGVAGAAKMSPHGLVQELLNRSAAHLWGFVSNGLRLRILRDNVSLTRQAFVEFDLELMMTGELYADFTLLWLLCHESRVNAERPAECRLEQWSKQAQQIGTRALEQLRNGVEEAIKSLGRGFLAHPANGRLRQRLVGGALDKQDFYRQLLRLVYRLLFLFVAEDRDLLFAPETGERARNLYTRFYSLSRLRRLAERRIGTRHHDLFQGLRLVMNKLSGEGDEQGYQELGLPALGSFLFSRDAIADLDDCEIENAHLLSAIRALAFLTDQHGLRTVDYKNLRSEELGSIYEALLELHPEINAEAKAFNLSSASGNERKTTGSYYTPDSLVQCLLDSALDPVVDEAIKRAAEGEKGRGGDRETLGQGESAIPESQSAIEQAILNLKVCDPACGSGHFLIAAAHRMAKRLGAIRTGDEEPSPAAVRKALRDVIGHCIYGVDINPMAVELCKVSLWMESLEPGKPLTFLEHRIQPGNALIGATPALLKQGIPDEAFKPIEGDDREYCNEYRRQNRQERKDRQRPLIDESIKLGNLAASIAELDAIDDAEIAGVHAKQQRYEELVKSSGYLYGRFLADAWCAAFVWKKTREFPYPITEAVFREIEQNPYRHATGHGGGWLEREVKRLAAQYQFFHWHLAFPDVFRLPGNGEEMENEQAGWSGGFNVVLGNPPWEHTELKEKEWFAQRRPEIANVLTGAERKRMIDALAEGDTALYTAFLDARREHDGVSYFAGNSGRFPLCGRGRINTYAIFAETNRMLINEQGRVGCIVPSGIATDDTTKFFFQSLVSSQSLASLYDFENREGLFPAVDSRAKFCLLTMTGTQNPARQGAEFVFFAHKVEDLRDDNRRFTLSDEEITLLNPNTRTCPVFRTKRDAEFTKAIYARVPVLIRESVPAGNAWGIDFKQGLFNMTSASGLFRTREDLLKDGWRLAGNIFSKDDESYLPLYEAKMVSFFDHRYADVVISDTAMIRQGQSDELSAEEHRKFDRNAMPRNWVARTNVEESLTKYDKHGNVVWFWPNKWLLCWRDVTSATNERTFISSLIPRVGVGNNLFLAFSEGSVAYNAISLLANFNSFVFDFVVRQNIGGVHLNFFIVRQLPILPPHTYSQQCPWQFKQKLREWIAPRVLELTYTAYDLRGFAEDCGYAGEPFRWPSGNDASRRFLLRSELDAAYFHLYGITRDDVDYILDTFPIVRRKDEAQHGEYRTKRVILEIYDAMQQAITTGQPYQTRLDPPPANGWTPPPLKDEDKEGKRETGTGNGSPLLEFQLRQEDARLQPGLFDEAKFGV